MSASRDDTDGISMQNETRLLLVHDRCDKRLKLVNAQFVL